MQFKTYIFSGLGGLGLALGCVQDTPLSYAITQNHLQAHVEFLSSNALAGRLTGTEGERLAAQYAADAFQKLGLTPAGDNGTYFQHFNFTAGVSLGKNNLFSITTAKGKSNNLVLGRQWRPLSFSDNKSFKSAQLVFAGYGISAPALGHLPAYDSYQDLNVKNKWVIVFRYTPEKMSAEQAHQLSQYSSLRYKAFTAKEKGAKGIIFVSGPNAKVKNQLIPLSFDTSLSGAGIIAISVTDSVLSQLLKNNPNKFNSLKQLQDRLDSGHPDPGFEFKNTEILGRVDVAQNKQQGCNVLAKLKLAEENAPTLIVSAHIDHLGRGELSGSRSREAEPKLIHYGADDNASGVASVLEAAATLRDLKSRAKLSGNKNIIFALWSGEELGLLGSAHFIKHFLTTAKTNSLRPAIDTNINLDMVGRLREHLIIQGVGSSLTWPKLIEQVSNKHNVSVIAQNDPYLPTDSTSFYLHGIPTVNLFTGSHDEYHTSRDTLDTLNYAGIKSIANFLVGLILALEETSTAIDYQKVEKTTNHPSRGFRVYLGTIPDYASPNISGVKLSGVTKDSPAERAGLKQNDVIVQLAGKKIHDIYDYTFVLSSLPVAKPVALTVLRDLKRVPLMIVAQSRE